MYICVFYFICIYIYIYIYIHTPCGKNTAIGPDVGFRGFTVYT